MKDMKMKETVSTCKKKKEQNWIETKTNSRNSRISFLIGAEAKNNLFQICFVYLDAWTFLLSFLELSREFADIVESFRDNESACCTLWRTTDNGFSATLKWLWW